MAPSPDRAARVATLALMAVAYATCEVAAYPDGRPRPVGVGFGVGAFALAVLAAFTLRPRAADARPSRRLSLILGAILLLPVLAEPLVRSLAGEGFPLEMQLVNGLRVLGLSLAGLSAWPKLRRLAGVVALFLALFASAMGDQPAIPYLLAAFALTGGVWLVLEHQSAAGTGTAVADGEWRERAALRLPYREAVVFGVLAVAAAAVAVAGPKRVMVSLGELVPTSGGTGDTDPFARYGVGDGPEETAGPNARAAGMVETDRMIEDNSNNSLIDAVNDMYGPPHKPRTDQERLVAAGLAEIIQNHGKLPDNRKPSRDFDTARTGPKTGRKPDSRGARGVFEVEGRTPLHVRLVAYETYDPAEKRWREGRKPAGRALDPEGGDWMAVGNLRAAGWYAADDRHRLKAADLRDNLVPTPAHLTRFRINKVDRPDYYEWDYEGVLALAGRKRTPPGVVVTTDCRTLDRRRLDGAAFSAAGAGAAPLLGVVPTDYREELDRIAAAWAGGLPRGWPQIDAVLARLRADYTLDRRAVAPADHPAPVLWFLTESRRGPDYQFATAAALLLRSLGYPARVCLGYYAAPAAYDPETDHTPVKATDLHLWPEVLLKDGHWLVVEPTPGFDVLPPLQTWGEWAADRFATVVAFVTRNAISLAVAAGLLIVLAWRWRRVWDGVVTLRWAAFPGRTWRQAVLRAAAVLDRRGALAGRGRRPTQSLSDWAGGLTPDDALGRLVGLAEQAAYAPALPPPIPEADILPLCRRTLREWPYRKFVPAAPGGPA